MVKSLSSKQKSWVRFPVPAPIKDTIVDKPCTCYVIEDFRFGNPNKHKDSRRELVVRVRTDPYCAQHGWKYHKAGTEEYNIDVYIREYITKHFP